MRKLPPSIMPPCYTAGIPLWNEALSKSEKQPVNFLNIHEVLGAFVEDTGADEWLQCNDQQLPFRQRVRKWGERVNIADTSEYAGLGLWGRWCSKHKTERRSYFDLALSYWCLLSQEIPHSPSIEKQVVQMWMQRDMYFPGNLRRDSMDVHCTDGRRLSSLGPRQQSIGRCVADSESSHKNWYWCMPSWQMFRLGLVKASHRAPWLDASRYC